MGYIDRGRGGDRGEFISKEIVKCILWNENPCKKIMWLYILGGRGGRGGALVQPPRGSNPASWVGL